jgi:ABC-type lipoprotein release transport system permease subunit
MGVDPAAERAALELHEELHEGSFLAAEPRGHAVIGRKLARSLDAALGSEIVAVVQAADGSMGNEIYHVTGILKNVSEEMDRSAVILHRDDFDGLFVAEGRVHEIAFGAGAHPVDEAVSILERAAGDTEVKSWRELLPATADMVAVTGAVMYLFSLIFFMAAGLGVLNTMLMAMYDRVREFGLIKSLGATSLRIVREVSAEAFLLAVVSTALGLVLGLAATAYLQIVGIDLRAFGSGSFSFAGIAWDPLWRAHLTATHVLVAVPTMWVVCVLSALYPAGKAARMDPVEAMTHV